MVDTDSVGLRLPQKTFVSINTNNDNRRFLGPQKK